MRLTTRTNLAMRTLMYCAVNRDRVVRTSEIAERCNASENHLGQVISALSRGGYVQTVRGRGGGIRLAKEPGDISVGHVVREFENDAPLADCFRGEASDCPIIPFCQLKGMLSGAIEAFYGALESATVLDLVEGNKGLKALFAPVPAEDF